MDLLQHPLQERDVRTMTFTGTLHPYQVEDVEKMKDLKRLLVAYGQGTGKAQPLFEQVLTPEGWTTLGRLQVGDYVIASNGRPTRVTGVFPQGEREFAFVRFTDGANVMCDWDHLWTTATSKQRRAGKWSTKSLRDIVAGGLKRESNNGERLHYVPLVQPVQHEAKDYPLDPYLLGVLLGDGSFRGGTPRLTTADEWMVEEVGSLLPQGLGVKQSAGRDFDYTLALPSRDSRFPNPIKSAVESMGLWGKASHEKWIPVEYLVGSVEQRLSVLQGLLDTDGWLEQNGARVCFASTSLQLTNDVAALARSLGGVAAPVARKENAFKGAWSISIALPQGMNPFRLPRKADRYVGRTKYPPARAIESVSSYGAAECVCISVEAEDSLYVTNDYVLTHNTVMTISALEDLFDDQRIVEPGLVICLAGLKYQWQKAIARFTCTSCNGTLEEDDCNGHSPTSTSIVIDGTPKQRAEQYAVAEDHDYIILGYEQVANEWETVKRLPRGFVVCDEVSMIKGFRAQRSKAVKKLRSEYRFGLTGTPMENGRPEEIFSIFEWIDKNLFGRFDLFDKAFIVRKDSGQVDRYRNIPTFRKRVDERMVRRTPKDPEVAPYMPEEDHKAPFLVPLDRGSRELYNVIADELILDLEQAANSFTNFDLNSHYGWGNSTDQADALRGAITSKMLALQMLCNHPDTLRLSAARYLDPASKDGSKYAAALHTRGLLDPAMGHPKMTATVDLIKGLLDQDKRNKVVLFTTYTDMVALFTEAFGDLAVPFTGKQNAKTKETNKVRFQTDPAVRVLVSSDAGGYGVDLPQANWLCVAATTPVLTDGLRWVPAGELRPGDGVLGVEEEISQRGVGPGGAGGRRRKWRLGTVTNNTLQHRETLRVTLSNGDDLVVTPEHRMLVVTGKGTRKWVEAKDLKPGWSVPKYLQTWEQREDFDSGWVSGMFDGEGCLSTNKEGYSLQVAQNKGPVLDRLWSLLQEAKYNVSLIHKEYKCSRIFLRGGQAETLRFLGEYQPTRLLRNWQSVVERCGPRAIESPTIASVESAGVQEVAVLETSIRTYIGAGYIHHNCNYDQPDKAGLADQRDTRIVRASSEFGVVSIQSILAKNTLEVRRYQALNQKRAVAGAFIDGQRINRRGGVDLDLDSITKFLKKVRP